MSPETTNPSPEGRALPRVAVIGIGHMGRIHAIRMAECPEARLVALADPDPARAQAIAAQAGCDFVADYRELLGRIDAACIAVPTVLHREVAESCLRAGVHVLIEKPLARTLDEADALMALAAERGLVLQVGHLQRYNPAFRALAEHDSRPLYLDVERLAPFKARGIDVDVVLDLMIHDLDMVLALARAPVENVSAAGFSVITDGIDIANARIEFADGSVANLSASRASQTPVRKFRVFWRDGYASADLQEQRVRFVRRGEQGMAEHDRTFERVDEIGAQGLAFARAVAGHEPPPVSGAEGRLALQMALEVVDRIQQRLERYEHADG